MHFRTTKVLGLLTAFSAPISAYWRMACPSRLVDERADPIVSPGAVGGHVHQISGGNGFALEMNYTDARASTCSSCPIKQDLSNYWTPTLYVNAKNGSGFSAVPVAGDGIGTTGGMTVYYQQRPGPDNDPLEAFPEGLRMIAGNPFQRNYTGTFAAQAISFACLDYNGPATPYTNGFPDRNCPDGLRVQVYFPSCWDGVNLDSPDHSSHMSYPADTAYNNGRCPSTHPVHLISIFYEVIYQTDNYANEWNGNQHPFVLAQGDNTGYGFHGDFLNGWDVPTLQAAVNDCNDATGNTTACQHFQFFEDAESQSCHLAPVINEDIIGPMANLPGCNSIQSGPGLATSSDEAHCPVNSSLINTTPPNPITASGGSDLTGLGWSYIGCGMDNYFQRTFTDATTASDTMTLESCVAFCGSKTMSFAGVEYARECYCSASAPAPDRAPVAGVNGNCVQKCSGNATETCGGSAAMNMYQKCGPGECVNNVAKPGPVMLMPPSRRSRVMKT